MNRQILALFLCLALSLSLFSCGGKNDENESEEIKYEDTELSAEDINIIKKWWDVSSYDISYDVYVTIITDGDTENPGGSASSFKIRKINDKEKNMYYGKYSFQSSVFPYPMSYDYYFADGVQYQIYYDSDTTEELDLNQYEACEITEEDFIFSFDGFEFVMPTEEEFASASEKISNTGAKTVSLFLKDENSIKAIVGDADFYELNAGAHKGSVKFTDVAVTFGIENGELVGIIATFDIDYSTDDYDSVHVQYDKSWTINAINDDVESFTLPEKSLFEVIN